MRVKSALVIFTIGFLVLGVFISQVEARRKILRGRKTITRRYYHGTAIPAWSIIVLCGLGMLAVGGGLYLILRKVIVSGSEDTSTNSYHRAMQDDV